MFDRYDGDAVHAALCTNAEGVPGNQPLVAETAAKKACYTEYGICKGAARLAIQWVEDEPVKDGAFAPPGKKVLKSGSLL
ncbi:MAG: hypothetical protein LBG43_05040 [Treponema sp.]|jgi:hypothetical protein|nr:hypothetical protein [Treponema sp.]